MCANPICTVDSMTFDGDVQMDTLHMLLPRTLVTIVHDTLIKTDTIVKNNIVYVKDTIYIDKCNEEKGIFSVSANKQVYFSKGNLQYQASTKIWRFAEHQYDYIEATNANVSDTYDGWIDLFGWSADNTTAPFGISSSVDITDYSGGFVDWGTNAIGADAPNTWRTMTQSEWNYLFRGRADAAKLFGFARFPNMNVTGIIILPDKYQMPEGISFISCEEENFVWTDDSYYLKEIGDGNAPNAYSLSDWQKMENAGAVFLPAAGGRNGVSVTGSVTWGHYWSASVYDDEDAYFVYFFNHRYLYPDKVWSRLLGLSVRLVKDVE